MTAGGFSDSPHFMYSGWRSSGTWFQLYQIGFGGIPARPHGDGIDGHCLWPAMKSVPMEFLELYYPLRMEAYHTIADSGGAGLFRGGNAQRIRYRFLEEGEVSIHDDRWLSKPWGVMGGEPGRRGRKVLYRYSQSEVWREGKGKDDPEIKGETVPAKTDHVRVYPGDVLEWMTWGGGGYGDALTRDPELVVLEVAKGLVSVQGAREGYGVVVVPPSHLRNEKSGGGAKSDFYTVDADATTRLREEMSEVKKSHKEKNPPKDKLDEIFNRGGSWEDIKRNCKEETGLDPPKWPWEVPMRGPHTRLDYVKDWMDKHGMMGEKKSEKKDGEAVNGVNGVKG